MQLTCIFRGHKWVGRRNKVRAMGFISRYRVAYCLRCQRQIVLDVCLLPDDEEQL